MQKQGHIQIINVTDGDTVTGRYGANKQYVRVRLHGIDAPESEQPLGPDARHALSRMVGQRCSMRVVQQSDRYGRVVGILYPLNGNANQSFNIELLRQGWAYSAYHSKSPPAQRKSYQDAENSARANRVGVWRDSPRGGTRPWIWRRDHPRQERANRVAKTLFACAVLLFMLLAIIIYLLNE